MAQVFLGLGSNLGDRLASLEKAVAALTALGPVRKSNWYETEPVGPGLAGEPRFLNGAVALDTEMAIPELMDKVLSLEQELGREPERRRGSRTIDIDILLAGDKVRDGSHVQVPHPRMHERGFVLKPMADIAAGAVHPVSGQTVGQMLAATDCSGVKVFPGQ